MSVNKRIFAIMLAMCLVGFGAFAQTVDETAVEAEANAGELGYTEEVVEIPSSPVSDFVYEVASDYSSVLIIRYKGSDANVVVPSEIEGVPVVALGASAFVNNTSIESVIIPDSVVSLMGNAYTGNDGCFKGCKNLKSVIIPDAIDALPEACFYGCSSLEDIVLPSGIKEIPSFAFYKCSSLTSIEVPESVTSIGRNAFTACGALEDFYVPESITQLRFGNYHVFEGTKFVLSKKHEIYKLGYKGNF